MSPLPGLYTRSRHSNTYGECHKIRIMSKLTLSVDAPVIAGAKRYARARGVSVSKLVQAYLADLAEPQASEEEPPVLRSLRGTLGRATVNDYRKHLREKYR